jgi:hypothetical protein
MSDDLNLKQPTTKMGWPITTRCGDPWCRICIAHAQAAEDRLNLYKEQVLNEMKSQ